MVVYGRLFVFVLPRTGLGSVHKDVENDTRLDGVAQSELMAQLPCSRYAALVVAAGSPQMGSCFCTPRAGKLGWRYLQNGH
jgi:hypothetical protein